MNSVANLNTIIGHLTDMSQWKKQSWGGIHEQCSL